MTRVRNLVSITLVVAVATFIAVWLAAESRAQAPDAGALAGAWTLNHDLSDQPPSTDRRRDDGSGGRRGGFGGGMGRGGMRRGGFGGGMGGGGRASMDPEEMTRVRDAMRDILAAPDHLTIVQADAMIVVTGPDGRTTRLSPDGKKVKDDNTKIERKTHWDGGKLVSEISGVGPGKMTQSFSVDPEKHQLRIVVEMEGGRSRQPRTITHVYDADAS
jgi:hypothetical protein